MSDSAFLLPGFPSSKPASLVPLLNLMNFVLKCKYKFTRGRNYVGVNIERS